MCEVRQEQAMFKEPVWLIDGFAGWVIFRFLLRLGIGSTTHVATMHIACLLTCLSAQVFVYWLNAFGLFVENRCLLYYSGLTCFTFLLGVKCDDCDSCSVESITLF